MTDLARTRFDGTGHDWVIYDETHRACSRCSVRLHLGRMGWTLTDYRGVPSMPLLGDGSGGFGGCVAPPAPVIEAALIDYTGDPDLHPGCERYVHRLVDNRVGDGSVAALVHAGAVRTVCGFQPTWWEIGPARDWHGWSWCADCFGGSNFRRPKSSPLKRRPRELQEAPRRAPSPPLLPARAPAQQRPPALPAAPLALPAPAGQGGLKFAQVRVRQNPGLLPADTAIRELQAIDRHRLKR